jgi:3-oxoacyl-[acyl-carrier-protein] synthase II
MGSLSPLGSTVAENWDNAVNGRSGIAPITRFDVSLFATRIAGELKNFDPVTYIEPKEVKKLDLFSQFALGASEEAWQSAKLEHHPYDPSMMGCILGIGVGGLGTLEKYHGAYMEGGPRKISPFLIPAMISNLGPGNLGIKYGLKGVNYAITSACTSATHALGEAYRMIADGLQDLIVAGGTEAAITPIGIGGFCSMKAMSTRNEEPLKASRPFDKDRDGFVMGEGSTILVLEALESAEKRGATILAEISGYGFSCDAYHITSPSPDGQGAVQCMSMALRSAKLAPEQVQYVNAHGTSTEFNDASETAGIKKVFGSWATNGLVVSSTKSMTGHLLGAAGAIEALLCVKAIQEEIVPPTINLDNPGEGCDLDYVPHTARPLKIQHAISNSFGFGGTNATVVISRAS